MQCFAYPYCLSLRSTRVSNELGAGNVDRAKKAMAVTLKLCLLLAILVVLAVAFGHNIWVHLFSNSHTIREEFSSMIPFLAISIAIDSVQGVFSGSAQTLFCSVSCFLLHVVIMNHFN